MASCPISKAWPAWPALKDLSLIIDNSALQSLAGLRRLDYIGGDLLIVDNGALLSLEGLHRLRRIRGVLSIFGNSALTNLVGLART